MIPVVSVSAAVSSSLRGGRSSGIRMGIPIETEGMIIIPFELPAVAIGAQRTKEPAREVCRTHVRTLARTSREEGAGCGVAPLPPGLRLNEFARLYDVRCSTVECLQ